MLSGEFMNSTEFLSHFHMTHGCFKSICGLIREKGMFSNIIASFELDFLAY